ncbi:unnamed protein product, partial [Rangifer tarandus platyrhynchus]
MLWMVPCEETAGRLAGPDGYVLTTPSLFAILTGPSPALDGQHGGGRALGAITVSEELGGVRRPHSQGTECRHLAPSAASALLVAAKSCGLCFGLSQSFQKPEAYQESELKLKLNMLNGAQI